jgi:hypothetical protein
MRNLIGTLQQGDETCLTDLNVMLFEIPCTQTGRFFIPGSLISQKSKPFILISSPWFYLIKGALRFSSNLRCQWGKTRYFLFHFRGILLKPSTYVLLSLLPR